VRQKPLRDLIIYCDRASNTARELAIRLNCRRLYSSANRGLRRNDGALVVNYGTSHSPNFSLGNKSAVLNPPEVVKRAISKRVAYEAFKSHGVPTLDFTVQRDVATKWLQDGCGVLCRRDGLSGGKGINFVPKGSQDCPNADFYTKYFAKTHEYRAHVVNGKLIDLTQKKLQNGHAKGDSENSVSRIVRSLDNGWIHAHEFDVSSTARKAIEHAAVSAIQSLGLDFGAVDILVKYPKGGITAPVLAVCEVNTAPGLGNEVTLNAYVEAFKAKYGSTVQSRAVSLPPVRRKRVRRMVEVFVTTRKGNRVKRLRERLVYEDTGELVMRASK